MWLGLVASSDAGVRISVSSDASAVNTLGTRHVAFRVTLATDPLGGRYRVELRPQRFGLSRPQEGAYIYPDDHAVVTGAGVLNSRRPLVGLPACPHGLEIATQRLDLTLPSNSTTVVDAPYRRSLDLPWPGADYRLAVVALPLTSDGRRDTSQKAVTARPPQIPIKGPVGVRIIVRVSPDPFATRRRFRLGNAIVVRGRTTPALRNRKLSWRYRRGTSTRTATIIRTDRRGRFGPMRWKPNATGRYQHWLSYHAAPKGKVRSDRSCPQPLTVSR
jgi:hypothetical protein